MKKFENLLILVLVCAGAVFLYRQLDSMGPEFEPQSPPAAQKEAAAAETKPVAPEAPAQPAATTTAPAKAETPATTTAETKPAAPATPSPSTEPAAQPAAQPAAPATPMVEQPAAPAVASAPAAPATPEKPATPVAEQPPVPATPAQPVPVAVPPAPATPAPVATVPMPQPAAPAPVQVATATPPPAPVVPAAPQKKLAELTQDDLMGRLPVNAKMAYRTARSDAESKGEMIGLRSWFGQWRRYLADPMRAVLEVDMANLLIQSKASYPNESAAKAAKRGNASEARMLITGILSRRINNPELSEMVEKVRQDVERELSQLR